jgi:hypothetical protein
VNGTCRLRQPVRPLDITVITELQHRMITAAGRHDKFVQISPPAQLRAEAHGLPQPGLVGQIPGQRAGHPAAHVIKGPRGLGEIEHRLLDRSPRRIAVTLRGLERPRGTMDRGPGNAVDMALARNGHMDRIGQPVVQAMQFGRCFMRENGTRPGRKHRCPQQRPRPGTPVKVAYTPG